MTYISGNDDKIINLLNLDNREILGENIEMSVLLSLKDICDIENNYTDMIKFIEKNAKNKSALNNNIDNIVYTISKCDHIKLRSTCHDKEIKNIKLLLMLKIFKKIKEIELTHLCTKNKSHIPNDNDISISISNDIHKFNITSDNNYDDKSFELLKNIMTPTKIKYELLKYELINYSPNNKIIVESPVNAYPDSISNLMTNEINRFNIFIENIIEDDTWIINFKNTKNFSVPKNKFIISNTIEIDNITNCALSEHMELLSNYLKRMFDMASLKYAIVEDNKYYMAWILIIIGYHTKK